MLTNEIKAIENSNETFLRHPKYTRQKRKLQTGVRWKKINAKTKMNRMKEIIKNLKVVNELKQELIKYGNILQKMQQLMKGIWEQKIIPTFLEMTLPVTIPRKTDR